MSNILVTGGAGFIGSHVTEALIERGHSVVVLDDLSGGFTENVIDGATFVQGSINDVDLVNELFEQTRFEYIYHLAAYAAEGLSHFIKRFNYNNNLIGSINLINAAINTGVKCFVFTSSIAVYGSSPELPPHTVYGERQNIGDKYRNVVGIFINQILQDKPMTVFGDGAQNRAFSYIGDVAPIMAAAIDIPAAYNQIFNIGADQPYTVNELAEAVAHAMGVEPNILRTPARNEVVSAYSSHAKLRHVFGERQPYSLEDGLQRMATWVKQHGARASTKFEGVEVTKNFPKAWLM